MLILSAWSIDIPFGTQPGDLVMQQETRMNRDQMKLDDRKEEYAPPFV